MGKIAVVGQRTVIPTKRSPTTTTTTTTFRIGGWVLLALSLLLFLLPTARSFSTPIHGCSSFPTVLDRERDLYRDPRPQPGQHGPSVSSCWNPTISNPSGEKNGNCIPSGTAARTPKTRTRTTRLLYRNYGFDGETPTSFSSAVELPEDLDCSETTAAGGGLTADTNRGIRSSMHRDWRGLKRLSSSPAVVAVAKRGGNSNSNSNSNSNRNRNSDGSEVDGFMGDRDEGIADTSGGLIVYRTPKSSGTSSPMIIQPNGLHSWFLSSPTVLREIVESNRSWIQRRVLDHGAVVFRGFDLLEDDHAGSDAVREIGRILEHPGSLQSRNVGLRSYVVVSSRSNQRDQRTTNERCWEEIGTDASITDLRAIHRDLNSELRAKLAAKKLLYTRSDDPPASDDVVDDDNARGWFQLYGTINRRSFERVYKKLVGTKKIRNRCRGTATSKFESESQFESDAFLLHPITDEPVWFPLAHTFHWTSLPAQLWSEFRRTRTLSVLGRALRVSARSLWKHGIRGQRTTPVDVTYGDGTPISVREMHQIRRAIQKNTAWGCFRVGDLWIVDGWSAGVQ